MKKIIADFSPGPAQLYFTVQDHVRTAFRNNIPSLSHRSAEFVSLYQQTVEALRTLLALPDNYHIFFLSSTTEACERTIQNLAPEHVTVFTNGDYSNRFFDIARLLAKKAERVTAPEGESFTEQHLVKAVKRTELVAITHTETATGAVWPTELLNMVREYYPNSLIAVNACTALPHINFDYTKIDAAFFSVHKGFGLPPGLGVWLVNDSCIARAERLIRKKHRIGSYHNLLGLHAHAQKGQTPEAPNVLGIYLLCKVAEDMIRRDIRMIRSETEYKAAILYQAMEAHPTLKPYVKEPAHRSKTVIVGQGSDVMESLIQRLEEKGIKPGPGKGSLLRFANYPAHSKEQMELLVDALV